MRHREANEDDIARALRELRAESFEQYAVPHRPVYVLREGTQARAAETLAQVFGGDGEVLIEIWEIFHDDEGLAAELEELRAGAGYPEGERAFLREWIDASDAEYLRGMLYGVLRRMVDFSLYKPARRLVLYQSHDDWFVAAPTPRERPAVRAALAEFRR